MKYVSYLRLSKLEAGKTIEDSLGIKAQRADIARHIEINPGELIHEFVEIETGTSKKIRIEVYKAIDLCQRIGAKLIVAKLDRLARNVQFTSKLMESGIDFVCCDNPNADKFSIHILAAMAEKEAESIANRIKSALNQAKIKGTKLGSHRQSINHLNDAARKESAKVRREIAELNPKNRIATAFILKCKKNNEALQSIANQLNEMGLKNSKNLLFSAKFVEILWKRAIKSNNP